MEIAQLKVYTCYSLLASTNRIPDLVAKSKAYGYTAMAITDINVMSGAIEFYEACQKEGIQPIFGLTLEYHLEMTKAIQQNNEINNNVDINSDVNRIHVSDLTVDSYQFKTNSNLDENKISTDSQKRLAPIFTETIADADFNLANKKTQTHKPYQLILLAKNLAGYQNLIKISSAKMLKSDQTDFSLREISHLLHDLVIIHPDTQSHLSQLVNQGEIVLAKELLQTWNQLTDNDIYGGLVLSKEQERLANWRKFAAETHLPLVALQDVRYQVPSEDFSLQVLRKISDGGQLSLSENETTGPFYLPTAKAMVEKFRYSGDETALKNITEIVQKCQVEIPMHQRLLPHFSLPKDVTAATYLRQLCYQNLPLRINQVTSEYTNRLELELNTIHDMGFDDYFLIVWDVMDFAHKNQIVTGAGRGSAAGSLVSYVLRITDVDPIQYNLLFERFLNKERHTMPDIDLDIPDNRRDEVLHYVLEKYGQNHMAQIATFGTMAAKMVLRDVCRVFGLSQSEANQWAQAVPNVLKITLSQARKQSNKLAQLIEASKENKLLFEIAEKLEGLPRHVSTHAAGVVISDIQLTDLVPLQIGTNHILLTQFVMGDVEAIGLLKMDFLGLRNLSIMDHTLKLIKREEKKTLDIKQIPLNDPKTLSLFQTGQTTGVFQFESAGIRNVLRKLGPTSLEDIAAVNALYRPGPMQNIDLFINRKKGKVPIEYPDESLIPILEVTYGVMVYQEQVMQVAARLAGFSLGQADILRRAISKKKKSVLDEQRNYFVQGALAEGHDSSVANYVYDYIESFANYGFNRSHAVAYSMMAYQMAYLKVHYPAAFFTALLHSVKHNPKKMKEYLSEAKNFRVKILSPDINRSYYSFTLQKSAILFGFASLKGIRRDFIQNVIDVRKQAGAYKSLEDFLLRIDSRWLKVDNILPLIYIGAFDSLHQNRRQLVTDVEGMIQNIQYSGGSIDLLEILSLKEDTLTDYSLEEKLAQEEQYLGMYISGHPVEEYQRLQLLKPILPINRCQVGKNADILIYTKSVRVIRTKKGESMAFVDGDDLTGSISITIFPRLYRQLHGQIELNQVYYTSGKVENSRYNQEVQLLAEEFTLASNLVSQMDTMTCFLKIKAGADNPELMQKLNQLLQEYPGNTPIILYNETKKTTLALNAKNWIKNTAKIKERLQILLGAENVIFK